MSVCALESYAPHRGRLFLLTLIVLSAAMGLDVIYRNEATERAVGIVTDINPYRENGHVLLGQAQHPHPTACEEVDRLEACR